jgi:DNA-binding MarR family transcriptional regulator
VARTTELRAPASATDALALDRIRIAEFRVQLRLFLRQSEQVCRAWGLTRQRYMLLLAIKGAPDGREQLSFTDVSGRLQLSRNTVTELVARAEKAGLVSREPSEVDQRVVRLRLTAEGERRLRGVLLESDRYREELLHGFQALADTFQAAIERPARRRARRA